MPSNPILKCCWILCVCFASGRAQDNWTWRSSALPGNSLNGAAWTGSQAIAVGNAGTILGSPTGLAGTWTTRPSKVLADLESVVWTGTRLVAVGDSGTVLLSTDGSTWVPRHVAKEFLLTSVAWSGSKLVAVGRGDSVFTSADGNTWVASALPDSGYFLYGVSYGAGLWVAVGQYGRILTSTDGTTWTPRATGAVRRLNLRAVLHTGTQFVAIGDTMYTSTDGIAWTGNDSRRFRSLFGITRSDSRTLVVGGYDSAYISTTGSVWSRYSPWGNDSNEVTTLLAATWTGTRFLAVAATGAVRSSTDGKSWKGEVSRTDFRKRFLSVAASGTTIVAVGDSALVRTSPDGKEWTTVDLQSMLVRSGFWGVGFPYPGELVKVVWTGTRFVVLTTERDWKGTPIYSSPDGVSWSGAFLDSNSTSYQGITRSAVQAGPTLVVVGDSGSIHTSLVDSVYIRRTSNTNVDLLGVAWTGSRVVAVGKEGTILTSADGIAWTPRFSGTVENLLDVFWTGTELVTIGKNGSVLASPDGGTWTPVATVGPEPHPIWSVMRSGGVFLAVDWYDRVYSSTDARSWIPHSIPTKSVVRDIVLSRDRFVAVGDAQQILTSDYVPPSGTAPRSERTPLVRLRDGGRLLSISMDGDPAGPIRVRVLSLDGRCLHSDESPWAPEIEVPLDGLAPGMKILEVRGSYGARSLPFLVSR